MDTLSPAHPHSLSGFARPVAESQSTFHAAMMALARPGQRQTLAASLTPPAPLSEGVAALALALCDFETTIWLDPAFTVSDEIASYLRFHTGARIVTSPAQANFALVGETAALPAFDAFALGTLDYPDRSTTLILQLPSLDGGPPFALSGPGVAGEVSLAAHPLPPDFEARMQANRAVFPRGVDLLIVAGLSLIGLPRSTSIRKAGG
ncbi:MAG: phosphonate C-P lyase system protein PhnH [Beijerinckiaceae bacterium]|nr:phosphonate C-P lyase system protein PhnH [Beijerinckiaceae bacterium]